MTDQEKNEFIARALEPEPTIGHRDLGGFSVCGLYVVRGWGDFVDEGDDPWFVPDLQPRPFHTDWAAMGALLEAMKQRRLIVKIGTKGFDLWGCAYERNDGEYIELGEDDDHWKPTLPLAVRDAAFKALGGEE